MNYLKRRDEGYPFSFFTEKAFHKEQVVGYITEAYKQLALDYEVIQASNISHRDLFTFTLGTVGRIVNLEENHYDLFFNDADNDYIRDLADHYEGDLIKVTEDYLDGRYMSLNPEMTAMFEKDIKTVFEMENMFYLNANIPYKSMWFFRREGDIAPFSEENINKVFRNIPITRVW